MLIRFLIHPLAIACGVVLPIACAQAITLPATNLAVDGAHQADLHWVNFQGVTSAQLGAANPYDTTVPSGGTVPLALSFTLQAVDQTFGTRAVGWFSGNALGRSGQYSQSSGQHALRATHPTTGPQTGSLQLTGITLRNPAGQRLQFLWVTADAETTDASEYIRGTTDGTDWASYEELPPVPPPAGLGQGAVSLTLGSSFAIESTIPLPDVYRYANAPAHLLATQTPSAIRIEMGGRLNGAQAVAFAVSPLMPRAAVTCTPAALADSAGQVSTCTVTVTNPPLDDFTIDVGVTSDPRYTSDCGTLSFVGGNAPSASQSCTITATPNTEPDDGSVTATVTILPSTAGNYEVDPNAGHFDVRVYDDDSLHPVPTLSGAFLGLLGLMLAGLGAIRHRRN